jgi:hypothetical protein
VSLNSSFDQRDRPEYLRDLGGCIAAITAATPDGVLVFFPSYHTLYRTVEFWRSDGGGALWRRLTGSKVRTGRRRGGRRGGGGRSWIAACTALHHPPTAGEHVCGVARRR